MLKNTQSLIQNNNILYLSYDGITDPLGQSQVLPYLVGLSKEGYRFHLISFEKAERFEKHESTIRRICEEAGITWHPLSYTKKPPLLSTMYDLRRMKQLAMKLNKRYNFSIVHCRSYISALVGLGMKRKLGTKFLFDMRGFWADERIDGGIWDLSNPVFKSVYNYFKRKELEFFKEADHTVSLTHNGKEEISSWESLRGRKLNIEVIPCCVDLELFNPGTIDPQRQKDLKKELGFKDEESIIGYVGSIGTWYMLPEMLDCFVELQKKDNSLRFLFVTGEKPETILTESRKRNIPDDRIIIRSCLHKEVPLHISLFDLSIFFIRPTFSKKASSPTKQGELMAMGIPIICNAGVGDTDRVVKEYSAGVVLSELDTKAYGTINPTDIPFDRERTMLGAREFYGLESGVHRYLDIYSRLSGEQN